MTADTMFITLSTPWRMSTSPLHPHFVLAVLMLLVCTPWSHAIYSSVITCNHAEPSMVQEDNPFLSYVQVGMFVLLPRMETNAPLFDRLAHTPSIASKACAVTLNPVN